MNKILDNYKFNHIWIFITDKCNLNCDYCFFKFKTKRKTLSLSLVKQLLNRLPPQNCYKFIISGGEPLLEWKESRLTFEYILNRFRKSYFSVQTNCTLIDYKKLQFFKNAGVNIEIGIDGSKDANMQHRKGINKRKYFALRRNIENILKNELSFSVTMTVHPSEVAVLFSNFIFLVSIGLKNIEIHPAFLEDWTAVRSKVFLKEYSKAIKYEANKNETELISKGYSFSQDESLDLVIMPNGKILPNWIYLSFPEYIRKSYYIMELRSNSLIIRKNILFNLLKSYKTLFTNKNTSYRDFSNFNIKLAMKYLKNNSYNSFINEYIKLCNKIKLSDKLSLGNRV